MYLVVFFTAVEALAIPVARESDRFIISFYPMFIRAKSPWLHGYHRRPDLLIPMRRTDFDSLEDAKAAIFEYIESFYNTRRRHSYLWGVSPREFEKSATLGTKAA